MKTQFQTQILVTSLNLIDRNSFAWSSASLYWKIHTSQFIYAHISFLLSTIWIICKQFIKMHGKSQRWSGSDHFSKSIIYNDLDTTVDRISITVILDLNRFKQNDELENFRFPITISLKDFFLNWVFNILDILICFIIYR